MIRRDGGDAFRSRVVCHRPAFSPGIEVVYGVHVGTRFARHVHRPFIFGIVEEGERSIVCAGETVRIARGECFVLNPMQVHTCHSSEPHSYTVVAVGTEVMRHAVRRATGADRLPFFPCIRLADAGLVEYFARSPFLLGAAGNIVDQRSNIDSFLRHLLARHAMPDKHDLPMPPDHLATAIARVCAFVAAHAEQRLSMAQLAGIAHVSPSYFQRTFVKVTGISAHDYLMQCRIRKARSLLEEGVEPADVALATGFFDQSHFSRVFRNKVGTTPGRYTRSHPDGRYQAICSPVSLSACSSGA